MLEDKETISTIAKRYFYPWDDRQSFPSQELRDIHTLLDTIYDQERIIKRLSEVYADIRQELINE